LENALTCFKIKFNTKYSTKNNDLIQTPEVSAQILDKKWQNESSIIIKQIEQVGAPTLMIKNKDKIYRN
jgi:hypothetical protein